MKTPEKNKNSSSYKLVSNKHATIVLAFVLVSWLACWVSLKDLEPTQRGTYGDMFGVVNALFSGLAFAGIILTILLQKEELKLQRTELSLTRNEFREQNQTFKTQRFESTFFNILAIHNKTVDSFGKTVTKRATNEAQEYTGKSVFIFLDKLIANSVGSISLFKMNEGHMEMWHRFQEFYRQEEPLLARYLRSLFTVLTFIDETKLIDEEEKPLYFSIVTSHFTIYEERVLYYVIFLESYSSRLNLDRFRSIFLTRKLNRIRRTDLHRFDHFNLLVSARKQLKDISKQTYT